MMRATHGRNVTAAALARALALLALFPLAAARAQAGAVPAESVAALSKEQARAIAAEAYVYGLPLVMNYKAMYLGSVAEDSPEFKAPFNQIKNVARVSTPDDKAIVAPNADTPYSWAYLDLRAEPVVLTTPHIEASRYFTVQLIDAYTHNFAYLGTRATKGAAGNYLIAGPNWKGRAPKGIARVVFCETPFAFALYRTQLFGPNDLENVKKIQAGYRVQTLSQFLGSAAPPAAPALSFPAWDEKKAQGLGFLEYLDFMLRLCPVHPSEQVLRKHLAAIGVGGGTPIDLSTLAPEMKEALGAGLAGMRAAIQKKAEADLPFTDLALSSVDTFGSREQLEASARRLGLKDFYVMRTFGTIFGLYGNSGEEAVYPNYLVDSENRPMDGSAHQYRLRLPAGKPLPAKAFWSLTMYDGKTILLVANPISRYLINSPMLPTMKRDADGGLTIYIQHDSPGKELESNWLPAPSGPFEVLMRLYLPEPEVLDHRWTLPPLERMK
jgi:hypothetical protein